MTPHKHAALIKQWADGAQIQSKSHHTNQWCDVVGNCPGWNAENEYRVKPQTIRYKRFLWVSSFAKDKTPKLLVVTPEEQQREPREQWASFVRWIDTEWQEVEV